LVPWRGEVVPWSGARKMCPGLERRRPGALDQDAQNLISILGIALGMSGPEYDSALAQHLRTRGGVDECRTLVVVL
jgi:hypothetical protein